MNIVCNPLGHQPTGQPVTSGVPNSEYEERKKGKPIIGQQATGHRPRGHWFPIQRQKQRKNTGVKNEDILYFI
jgi:hypothetical protein